MIHGRPLQQFLCRLAMYGALRMGSSAWPCVGFGLWGIGVLSLESLFWRAMQTKVPDQFESKAGEKGRLQGRPQVGKNMAPENGARPHDSSGGCSVAHQGRGPEILVAGCHARARAVGAGQSASMSLAIYTALATSRCLTEVLR